MSNTTESSPELLAHRSPIRRRALLISASALGLGLLGAGTAYGRDYLPGVPNLAPDPASLVLTALTNKMEIYSADGVGWADAPKPPLVHQHFTQTFALSDLHSFQRCPCGALRFDSSPEDHLPWVEFSQRDYQDMRARNSLQEDEAPLSNATMAAHKYLLDHSIDVPEFDTEVRPRARVLLKEAVAGGYQTSLNGMHAAMAHANHEQTS